MFFLQYSVHKRTLQHAVQKRTLQLLCAQTHSLSPLSTFGSATRVGQVVRPNGSSTKNAKREPPLESHARLASRAKTNGHATKQRNQWSSSTLDSATRMAKYCGRGLAKRASDRPGKTPSREPSLESPCDWPHGPRRVDWLQTAKKLSSPTSERATRMAK